MVVIPLRIICCISSRDGKSVLKRTFPGIVVPNEQALCIALISHNSDSIGCILYP